MTTNFKESFSFILANEARALASCELRGNPLCNPFTWNHFKKDCCTFTQPCGIGEGQCLHDRECRANLVCGRNNCYHILGFPNNTNCCKPPGANDPGTLLLTHIGYFINWQKNHWNRLLIRYVSQRFSEWWMVNVGWVEPMRHWYYKKIQIQGV